MVINAKGSKKQGGGTLLGWGHGDSQENPPEKLTSASKPEGREGSTSISGEKLLGREGKEEVQRPWRQEPARAACFVPGRAKWPE